MVESQVRLLTEADDILDHCGRPRPPAAGTSAVYIKKGFLLQINFPANAGTQQQTITKEITGDTDWCLRSMLITNVQPGASPSLSPSVLVNIILPDGSYLSNSLQPSIQISGYGSWRYVFDFELPCPPGSKIQAVVNNATTSQNPATILFDGAYRYLLSGGERARILPANEAVEHLPRYFANPNQNIMAPAWQCGVVDPPPPGCYDEDFTYSALQNPSTTFPQGAPGSVISVTAANLTATQQIGMDGSEFHCQRILVEVSEDNTVTGGSVLAKIRLGSGQLVFDDYIDAARYIGSTSWPIDLIIPPNDIVYADLQVVDQVGTGNFYWTMYLEGFKRRKR